MTVADNDHLLFQGNHALLGGAIFSGVIGTIGGTLQVINNSSLYGIQLNTSTSAANVTVRPLFFV